jgi:hypothetical protein
VFVCDLRPAVDGLARRRLPAEGAEHDERNKATRREGFEGMDGRGEVDRLVVPRPDVAPALRDERVPLVGGEGAEDTP